MAKGLTYLNPPSATPIYGMYSHVAIVEPGARMAHIAGQVSVNAKGAVVGPDDIGAQVPVVFGQLEGILKDLDAGFDDVVSLTTYVVGRDRLEGWFEARTEVYQRIYPDGRYPPNTLVVVDGLNRPGLVLEIAAIARLAR
jgi:enamine deaminase RidA (YjgF/YER057c/UK114 family)